MLTSLVRPEAAEIQRGVQEGRPLRGRLPSWPVVAALFSSILVLAVMLLFFGQHHQKVRAYGVLLPQGGAIVVPAPSAGMVLAVPVAQGQSVRKGDSLVQFSTDALDGSAAAITAQRRASSLEELRQLAQVENAEASAYRQQLDEIRAHLESLDEDHRSVEQERSNRQRRIEIDELQMVRLRQLQKKGYVSEVQLNVREGELLEFRAQQARLERQSRAIEREIRALRSERSQLQATRSTAIAQRARTEDELHRLLAELDGQQLSPIVAPFDGTIVAVTVAAGQSVSHGQGLVVMMRDGGVLEGIAALPASSPGQIAIDDPVIIRLPAFPYQRYGHLTGRVRAISGTTLTAEQLLRDGLQAGSETPMYKVVIGIDPVSPSLLTQQLKPGMQIDADIVLEKRRLLSWMLDPLRSVVQKRSAS